MDSENPNIIPLPSRFQWTLFLTGSIGLIFISIAVILGTQTLGSWLFTPAILENILNSNDFLSAVNFLSYSILLILFWTWFRTTPLFLKLGKAFFNVSTLTKAIGYYGLLFLVLTVIGLLYEGLAIPVGDNNNQALISELTLQNPVLAIITFVFLGPIAEEITYRLGLFSLTYRLNRWLAYLITALVFGFIHFDYGSSNYINELLNMPLYIAAGVMFAFIYEKEGFEVATLTHIFNNGFSILIILLLPWISSSL